MYFICRIGLLLKLFVLGCFFNVLNGMWLLENGKILLYLDL